MSPIGWVRSGVLAGSLAALAGCGAVDAVKVEPVADRPIVREQEVVSPPGELDPWEAETAKVVPAPLPEIKPISPGRLVGMTREEAFALFGAPKGERSDPPATVWTWRSSRCQLDLFFYMDVNTRGMRALTYEVIGKPSQPTCLGELSKGTESVGNAGR